MPESDQAGTEERSGLQVGIPIRDREAEALVGDGLLGKAAVDRVTGETGAVTQVLLPSPAVDTFPARPPEPRNADTLTLGEAADPWPELANRADDLMAEHEGELWLSELSVDDVQVGSTDAAGMHLEANLSRTGDRIGQLGGLQLNTDPGEEHRLHQEPRLPCRRESLTPVRAPT